MALILFDYKCRDCDDVFEELVNRDNPGKVKCPNCKTSNTDRQLCAPRLDPKLGLDAEGFPTMGDKWARIRRQRAKIENGRDSND